MKYVGSARYTRINLTSLRAATKRFKIVREGLDYFRETLATSCYRGYNNARANTGRRARKSRLSSKYGPIFERSTIGVINREW